MSNEDSYSSVVARLEDDSPPKGLYLGVGPEQNLTLIAAARPSLALIADYRRRNGLVHLLHKALIMLANHRIDYLERLNSRSIRGLRTGASPAELVNALRTAPMDRGRLSHEVEEVRRLLAPLGWVDATEWEEIARIQVKLAGQGMQAKFLGLPGYPTVGEMIARRDPDGIARHFLASDEAYQRVRRMQVDDRILPLVADLTGRAALGAVASWMGARGLALSVAYLSDVEFFLWRNGTWPSYIENLERLPRRDGALIVRTSTRAVVHRDRRDGDRATTIARDLGEFLGLARAGRIRSAEDLFR